jgi:hypothetical protein
MKRSRTYISIDTKKEKKRLISSMNNLILVYTCCNHENNKEICNIYKCAGIPHNIVSGQTIAANHRKNSSYIN